MGLGLRLRLGLLGLLLLGKRSLLGGDHGLLGLRLLGLLRSGGPQLGGQLFGEFHR